MTSIPLPRRHGPLRCWLQRAGLAIPHCQPNAVFDNDLQQSAQLDGAGRLFIFFNIVLPLAGPGLTATAILTFLGAWGQYLIPLIFSPAQTKPLTVLIPEFVTKNFVDYGLITASGSVAIIIPALVVIFLNRYLVSGLLAGSVK